MSLQNNMRLWLLKRWSQVLDLQLWLMFNDHHSPISTLKNKFSISDLTHHLHSTTFSISFIYQYMRHKVS